MSTIVWFHQPVAARRPSFCHAHNRKAAGRTLQPRNRRFGILALGTGLWLALTASAAALSPHDVAIYRQAFTLAAQNQHDQAGVVAQQAQDPLPAKVLLWMKLAAPYGGTFDAITGFVRDNPDWPGGSVLRKQAERIIVESLDDAGIAKWFDANPPLTADGAFFYAEALLRTDQNERAQQAIRSAWVNLPMAASDEMPFVTRYAAFLRPQEHHARLDRLLWDHDVDAVQRMRPLLNDEDVAYTQARLALADSQPNALALAAAVPGSLRDEPSLLFDLARFKRKAGDDAGAAELLARAPFVREHEDKWWAERNLVARHLMERGDLGLAYQVVANHHPAEGSVNADAEFLAGWLALKTGKADVALARFQDLGRGSVSPITRARAAFWSARADEAAGDHGAAAQSLRAASAFTTTFYGQLAAARSGQPFILPTTPATTTADQQSFEHRELVRIVRDLGEILPHDDPRIAIFLRAIGQSARSGADYVLAARTARELNNPDVAITVAKAAVRADVYLMEDGYPVIKVPASSPESALIHAIIRQESTFNPEIVSPVGARGLMQLMPTTARLVAKRLNVKSTDAKLTTDPGLNVKLGSAYLDDLIHRFGGSYVLAVAAYNAGPQRVSDWMNQYGDPRSPSVDPADWVEQIPFAETRNYVQRVMEALLVYRARLHSPHASFDLDQDLRR